MQLYMLYFAAVADVIGLRQETLDAPDGATVANVRVLLCQKHPALEGRLGQVRVAVNERFASDDTQLADRDVVALIPPVAGG
jgi:molybdopterin synthase sulfur carrier subunit